jgi:Ala-tRNA(Pro) deacylase
MSAPASPEDLFARLDALGIAHATTRHRPIFTVDEGRDLRAQMPGGHSKNLFLTDKDGRLYLLCALDETKIALNALGRLLDAGRFSFGSAELMLEHLGVTPGSVTLFGLMNDEVSRMRLLMDAALLQHDPVHFHPLSNDATTAISPQDALRFAEATGHSPTLIGFEPDGTPRLIDR